MPSNQTTPQHSTRTLRISGIVVAIIAVSIVVIGITSRASNDDKLKKWTD